MRDADLRTILDIERIKQLKARYCRYVDTKQWDRLAALFLPETRFEGFGSAPTGANVAMFIAGISQRFAKVTSIHHCHMPEIAFTSRDTARGIWAMADYVEFPAGEIVREVPDSRGFMGYGHYEEEYARVGDAWLFSFLRLTRMRIDPLPGDRPAGRPGLLQASPGWLDVE